MGIVCERNSTMTQIEIAKRHAVLLWHPPGSSNTKISLSLEINLRTVHKIWKELDESNGDNEDVECTEALKTPSVRKEL